MLVDRLEWLVDNIEVPANLSTVQINLTDKIIFNSSWTEIVTPKCLEIVVTGLHPAELAGYNVLLFVVSLLLYHRIKKLRRIEEAFGVPFIIIVIYAMVFNVGYLIAAVLFCVIVAYDLMEKHAKKTQAH